MPGPNNTRPKNTVQAGLLYCAQVGKERTTAPRCEKDPQRRRRSLGGGIDPPDGKSPRRYITQKVKVPSPASGRSERMVITGEDGKDPWQRVSAASRLRGTVECV